MATGGQLTKSVIEASDFIHNFPCFPCSEERKNTEALYKCTECRTLYCQRCLDGHNRYIKNHTVLDVSGMKPGQSQNHRPTSSPTVIPVDICEEHHGKVIEMYCEEHDEACCSVCIAMKHRSCKGVEYIPNVAKKLLRAQDREKLKSNLKDITKDLRLLRSEQSKFLKELNEQRKSSVKEIQEFKLRLVRKVEKLGESSISEVEKRYKAVIDDLNHDTDRVDQMLNDAEKYLNKVTQVRYDDDAKLYTTMKLAERQVSKGNDCKDAHFGKPLEKINYKLSTSIEKYLEDIVSMGTLGVTRRTITPFVNILVPYPTNPVKSFTSTVQSDLLSVGIRSKFIKTCDADADVYTVVPISRARDQLELLNIKKENYCKTIIFVLADDSPSFAQRLKQSLLDFPFSAGQLTSENLLINVAKLVNITFTCSDDKYIFNQTKKAGALRLVSDIIAKKYK